MHNRFNDDHIIKGCPWKNQVVGGKSNLLDFKIIILNLDINLIPRDRIHLSFFAMLGL